MAPPKDNQESKETGCLNGTTNKLNPTYSSYKQSGLAQGQSGDPTVTSSTSRSRVATLASHVECARFLPCSTAKLVWLLRHQTRPQPQTRPQLQTRPQPRPLGVNRS